MPPRNGCRRVLMLMVQVREELDMAKKNFHALNTQLKEELPRFNNLVYDILRDSVGQFIRLYRVYHEESFGYILPIMQVIVILIVLFQTE